jgi:hypothetical protein
MADHAAAIFYKPGACMVWQRRGLGIQVPGRFSPGETLFS